MICLFRALFWIAAFCVGFASSVDAEPRTVSTIGPVHSLVAMVAGDIGRHELLMDAGASPHFYALKPSQSAALAEADIVFMVGGGLEPWVERSTKTLAENALLVELASVDGATRLPFRDLVTWSLSEGHIERTLNGIFEGTIDPHMWLSPDNAAIWLEAIAAALAEADPANSETYLVNAERAREDLENLSRRIGAQVPKALDGAYIVFHDAYQYFEHRFDMNPAGAVLVDGTHQPSAAHIHRLRELVSETGVNCLFVEPQFRPAIADTIAEGAEIRIAELDPLGAGLDTGPNLYPQLLQNLADTMFGCPWPRSSQSRRPHRRLEELFDNIR